MSEPHTEGWMNRWDMQGSNMVKYLYKPVS